MTKMFNTRVNGKWNIVLPEHRATVPNWPFWEKERLAAMYAAIRPGDAILDIGAEQGDMSALFAKWAGPNGDITLIEPSQGFWPNIKATFEANGLKPYRCYQALVSRKTEAQITDVQGKLYEWPVAARGEINLDVGFSHLNEKPDIPVVAIDDLDLPDVDIITMDIEGSEYEAVEGMLKTIDKFKPTIFISVHPEFMWREHGHTPDDLHVMLHKAGYEGTYLAFDHEQHWMYKPKAGA